MTTDRFIELIDGWLGDVRRTAIELKESGVPAERCIPLAAQIADAREIGRATERQRLTGVQIARAEHAN